MDRIDLIQAMQVLTLEPGDVLILRTSVVLQPHQRDAVREHIAQIVGDVPIMVLDSGLDLGVLRKTA